MAAWPPANPALAGKIPPRPPFRKGGMGGFGSYFLPNANPKIFFPSYSVPPHPIPLPQRGRGEGEGAIVKGLNAFELVTVRMVGKKQYQANLPTVEFPY